MKWFALTLVMFLSPLLANAEVFDVIPASGYVITTPISRHLLFGELNGESGVVRFSLPDSQSVALRLVAPEGPQAKTFDAVLVSESQGTVAAVLSAGTLAWEPVAHSMLSETLLHGPELTLALSPGEYRLVVTNGGNEGKFGVVLGGEDIFRIADLLHLVRIMPDLKRDYFLSSPFSFLASPLGIAYVVLSTLFGALIGCAMAIVAHPYAHLFPHSVRTLHRTRRRLVGGVCALAGLLLWYWVATHSWNFWQFACAGALLLCPMYPALTRALRTRR